MAEKQRERVRLLKDGEKEGGSYVLYWMQASARTEYNHALEYAVHLANTKERPLLVAFVITDSFPEANLRHYWFMVQGIKEVARSLKDRGIPFRLLKGEPAPAISHLAGAAAAVVLDRGYLRLQRRWRAELLRLLETSVYQVESEVVVPVEVASEKEEYTAATLRPKINRHLHRFLKPLEAVSLDSALRRSAGSIDSQIPRLPAEVSIDGAPRRVELLDPASLETPEALLEALPNIDSSVEPLDWISGGTGEAKERLSLFLREGLEEYDEARNDPAREGQSGLSPYLHFGQISPVYVALEAQKQGGHGVGAFLEELIVRRELSMNFCRYNESYDSYDALPEWARKTLSEHLSDPRPYTYDLETLEAGETDDPYWNAAQLQMVKSGKMHGYMRMYWGKKILEWTPSPREAFKNALYLNNKYELDGRDPNGFTGVAWCFGKHDRGWPERSVFGKVRYMNANGLRRKFKRIDEYVQHWTGGPDSSSPA
jgi:deoxyribodipyrimidine photo-lyase